MTVPFRSGLAALGACVSLAPSASAQTLRSTGPPQALVADGAPALSPRWSPDGTQIAFTRAGYRGLWVVEADGSDARQLSDRDAAGFGFTWSPDGQAVLTRPARFDGPERLNAVAVVDVATGAETVLTDWRLDMPTLPQWAASGRVVLDADATPEVLDLTPSNAVLRTADQPVAVVRAEGLVVIDGADGPRLVAGGRVLNPVLSPDGSRVVYEEMGGGLAVVRPDGTGRLALGPGHRPAWSPDGRWIVFMVTEDDGEVFTSADLVAVRPDGSGRVRLTDTPGRLEMNPSWSPDGRRIVYDDLSDGALYVLPVTE